jgi:hypothetical protein
LRQRRRNSPNIANRATGTSRLSTRWPSSTRQVKPRLYLESWRPRFHLRDAWAVRSVSP